MSLRVFRRAAFPAAAAAALAVALVAAPGARPASAADQPVAATFKVPRPETRTLPNGLVVHVLESHDLPTVYYRLLVKAGSRNEIAAKAGLAELTTSVMRQGTTSLSAQELSAKIDFVGGSLEADADRDYSIASAQVRTPDRDLALSLLADMVIHPAFAVTEVARMRSQTQAAIRQSRDDPGTVADEHLAALVHGHHPYSWPTSGDEFSVGGLTRDDLVAFHQQWWRPNNAILFVAGDVNATEIFAAVERAFGAWERADVPPPPAFDQPESTGSRVRMLDKPDLTQSQIRMGYVGLPRSTPDYFPVQVMNYIVGGGGFAARLTSEVRARAGLTYDIDTHMSYGVDRGTFVLSTFTKNETVGKALGMALDVIRRFRDQGPTADELEKAKAFYLGAFPFGFQTPGDVAEQWLRAEFYGLGDDYFDRYPERMRAVSAADVRRVAQAYLRTEPADFVVVGKAADVLPQLAAFGPAETLSFTARTGAIPEVQQAAPQAQGAPTPESRREAAALVAKALRAHGGRAALQAVRSWRSRGTITLTMGGQSLDGQTAEYVQLPARRRMEMTLMGQAMVQAMNGEQAWVLQGGQARVLSGDQLEAMREGSYANPLRLLLALSDPQADLRYLGPRQVAGRPAVALEWMRGGGQPARVYFDPDTGELVALEQLELSPAGAGWLPIQRVYDDYRKVGRIRYPFRDTVYSGGSKAVENRTQTLELNVAMPADLFRRPEG